MNKFGDTKTQNATRLTFHSKFKFFDIFQSRYAQDTDFSSYSSRRMYDMPSSSTLGGVSHMSSASTSSLTGPASNSGTNLIVNYLPQDMTDRELYSLFRPSGPIETCRIMRDYKVCHYCNVNQLNILILLILILFIL